MCPDFVFRLGSGDQILVFGASRLRCKDGFFIMDRGEESLPLAMVRKADIVCMLQCDGSESVPRGTVDLARRENCPAPGQPVWN